MPNPILTSVAKIFGRSADRPSAEPPQFPFLREAFSQSQGFLCLNAGSAGSGKSVASSAMAIEALELGYDLCFLGKPPREWPAFNFCAKDLGWAAHFDVDGGEWTTRSNPFSELPADRRVFCLLGADHIAGRGSRAATEIEEAAWSLLGAHPDRRWCLVVDETPTFASGTLVQLAHKALRSGGGAIFGVQSTDQALGAVDGLFAAEGCQKRLFLFKSHRADGAGGRWINKTLAHLTTRGDWEPALRMLNPGAAYEIVPGTTEWPNWRRIEGPIVRGLLDRKAAQRWTDMPNWRRLRDIETEALLASLPPASERERATL